MWIMTGDATDSRIAAVSPAIENSIRLVTQVIRAALLRHSQRLFKTHMAGAAKFLRQLISIQLRGIEDLEVFASGLDCRDMPFARSVTALAGNSRYQMAQL